ncbi:zinc transporter 9, partial [Clonorchis sinensis]
TSVGPNVRISHSLNRCNRLIVNRVTHNTERDEISFDNTGKFLIDQDLHVDSGPRFSNGPYEQSVFRESKFLPEKRTLALAYREARRGAKRHNYDSVRQWLMAGVDPSTSVVLLEDLAAVLGVLVAGTAMSITALTGSSLPDAVGAIGVSGILGAVAALIIRTNTEMLIGRSIPLEKQEAIMRLIDNMKVIRGTYDIKATMMGGDAMRFKAEVDIDGRELTKRYMETLPLDALLQEVKSIQTEQQLVHFMLKHGDNLVNTLGAEINQIEAKIK